MARRPQPRTQVHDLEILEDYYRRHQVPDPDSDCILWAAAQHRQGYGMMGAWRRSDGAKIMTTVHRVAARIHWDRPLSPREFVIHTCGRAGCCNPQHLTLGDHYEIHLQRRLRRRDHK